MRHFKSCAFILAGLLAFAPGAAMAQSHYATKQAQESYDSGIALERQAEERGDNAYLEKGIEFLGVIDFFQNMEKIFDETNYPQAFSVKRMFRPGIEVMSTNTEENVKEGKLATFSMRLLFRQNASWQGSVYWHEGKSDENFRSALELLFLMDSAISTKK